MKLSSWYKVHGRKYFDTIYFVYISLDETYVTPTSSVT